MTSATRGATATAAAGPWVRTRRSPRLLADLHAQAARSRAIIEAHPLDEAGKPGDRWDGADPATLERVLFHLLQEYARQGRHLDIVAELATGSSGE